MKIRRVFLLWLTLILGVSATAAPSTVSIDAKDGQLYHDPEATFTITSNTGSGSGITLRDALAPVTIGSLLHTTLPCDAVVRLGLSEMLKFSSVSVANALATLSFVGEDCEGLAPADSTLQQIDLSISDGAKVYMEVPLTANLVRFDGAGSLYVSEAFVSTVTNDAGMVYFVQGETDHLGIRTSTPFVFEVKREDGVSGEVIVEKSRNGNRSLTAEISSDLSTDLTEVQQLLVGGGHDVTVNPNVTLRQYDVLDAPEDFLDSVPECVLVASNSVGIFRISGDYFGKLAIADDLSSARGAVYVAAGATVQNYSEVTAYPLLGRHGYAGLDIAGTYTAIGCWQGGVDGQLFLKISEGGTFTHSSDRTSGFSLGGSDARVTLLVSGGTFDAVSAAGDVTLPLASDAGEVVVTAEEGGFISLGEKSLTANSRVRVNLNSGATLSANVLSAMDQAFVQFDGGYLRALQDGNPFAGSTSSRIYAFAGGAGYDVPAGLTAQIESVGQPHAPVGSGVTAIELGPNLEGVTFVAPPIVKITDSGSGRGATAVAELTDGAVTAIRVTSPGVNYSSPAASLVYGTDEIDLGAVTIDALEAGALLKRGAGTLEVNVATDLSGLKIYEGRVDLAVNSAVAEGPLYMAEGTVLGIGSTIQSFSDFRGHATIDSAEGGKIYLSGLSVDMERAKTNDVDTLDLSVFTLRDGCSITLTNFDNLDRVKGRYVLYHLSGDLPEQIPELDEKTYAAGLSRSWVVKREEADIVLRYIGGSLFIFY